jgi:hypothetical protein
MVNFRDRVFCASPGCQNRCGRQLTPEIQAAAERWWGGPGAPIAYGYFCGREPAPTSFTCPRCQRVSHHPKDVEHRFCVICGFADDPSPYL